MFNIRTICVHRIKADKKELGAKNLGQAYGQTEHVMARMNNYATRPSALPYLIYIPSKIPWVVLQASRSIHEVYPYSKAVPADLGIRSLGTSI